ncbi:MAG TPA: ABC transporter permease [Vicinamibacterales bacterium]|nr:ABC transporter permease [Vicinamibacterales bacterium]
MSTVRPPHLAERLLQSLLDERSRDVVVGDLHEGFHAVHERRGAAAAARWYWSQAIQSVFACRISGRRQADARQFDFEPVARVSARDLLRPAFRQFRDRPLYAAASCGTLALAIGVACASLTIVKSAFIDPLPYRDGHELVSLLTSVDGATSAVSTHVFEELRGNAPPLAQLAGIRPTSATYTNADGTSNILVSGVTSEYFSLLGVSPVQGRLWLPDETSATIVSDRFWREQLSGAGDVIGRAMVVDGRARTIVGVMPAQFVPPYFTNTDAWLPADMPALLSDIRTRRVLTVLARRAPHASQQDVEAFLAVFSRQQQDRFPELQRSQTWVARPLRDELVGSARPALMAIAAAALLLLMIVATNLAGLSTAQAVAARHQMAVRAALGATRARLFVEQLVDTFVLSLVGSLAGIWIAYGLITVAARYQQFFLGRIAPFSLDLPTIFAGIATGFLIGLFSALLPRSVVRVVANDTLRSSRSTTGDAGVTATRSALVAAQVAIALVMLVGAGLLIRTVQHLSQRELGFDPSGLTWLQVNLPGARYRTTEAQLQFERDVLERVRQIPGVTAATASVGFPLWGGTMAGLAIKGAPADSPRGEVAYLSVSPNFVNDIGARIIAGRDLLPTDSLNAPKAVVINETMARRFWPNGDALGAEVYIGPGTPGREWNTVVGIMADMRAHGVTEAIRPTSFGTTYQYSWPRRHIAVRTGAFRSATLAADLRAAVHAVDPGIAVAAVTTAEQALSAGMARHRLVMIALVVFGGVALVLCISGLYAVIVLNSQQRRREYAIRVALGASRGGVRWLVVRQALVLSVVGATAGLLTAVMGTRLIQGLLEGVQPIDPVTFSLATIALLALATIAAWHPARRAERVEPIETLRAE